MGHLVSHTVAFTGHRPQKLGGFGARTPIRVRLQQRLTQRLQEIRAVHPELTCISGMALGFDLWAAETCAYLGIAFTAAVPFDGQESRWPPDSQEFYRTLLAKAARIHVVCPGGYAPSKMQRRNMWMMDGCNYYVAAWDGSSGGTKNCIDYARQIRRPGENLLLDPIILSGAA